jgi:O-antigen ligase
MFKSKPYKHFAIIGYLLFFVAGMLSIVFREPLFLLIPFTWALLPIALYYIVVESKQLFWLLLILIPLSTELSITSSLGIDFPIEIVLFTLTIIAIAKMVHQPSLFSSSFQSPLFLLIVLHLFWIFFSCFFSTTPVLSIKYFLAKCWYIIPFVMVAPILLNQDSDWKKLALCLCIPMSVLIIQVLFRFGFYGFEFAMIKKTMFPFFRNHVNYSSLLVCLIPVGWIIWKFTPIQTLEKKGGFVLLIIALIALVLAYSRGAWLALFIGLFSVIIFQKKWMGRAIVASIILVGLIITALTYQKHYIQFAPNHDQTIFHENFSAHLSATINRKDISNAERFHRWVAGFRMIDEKPFIGFGPNSFYSQYQPYTVSAFKTWVSNNPEHSTVHNYFLLIAIEQGMIGLLLFLILFIYMLLEVQNLYHQFQTERYRSISLVVGIVLVMIGVINCGSDMIETDKIGSVFWLCGGALIALKKKLKTESAAIIGL